MSSATISNSVLLQAKAGTDEEKEGNGKEQCIQAREYH